MFAHKDCSINSEEDRFGQLSINITRHTWHFSALLRRQIVLRYGVSVTPNEAEYITYIHLFIAALE